jgi:hypothetical protein
MKADFKRAAGDVKTWSQTKLQRIQDTVNESAINIQSGAKKRCVVDTGRLRSSIAIEPSTGPGYALRVGTKVFYAPYVEFGTGIFSEHPTEPGRQTPWAFPVPKTGKNKDKYKFKKITAEDGQELFVTRGSKPHPFLFPAAEEERTNYLAAMRRVLSE